MNTTATYPAASGPVRVLRRAEAWLDQRGKGAWIAAMVVGFIAFWPVGLALLFYMIWGKKMFGSSCRHHGHHDRHSGRGWGNPAYRPSGNAAFDRYKAETLKRLEDEQEAFETFLQRLREARDKSEFDNFMDERARNRGTAEAAPAETDTAREADAPRRGEY